MDDMKRLVERYKRELMEYSKAARPEPKARLEFPEMTAETESPLPEKAELPTSPELPVTEEVRIAPAEIPETEEMHSAPAEVAVTEIIPAPERTSEHENDMQEKRTPEMIGYVDGGDIMSAFNDMFANGSFSHQTASNADIPVPIAQDNNTPEDDGISTVTPERAEQLNDIPESGTSLDEQLGKRDFEEQSDVTNSREDVRPLRQDGSAPVMSNREYSSEEDFNRENDRRGTVRFRTYTARGALPVPNAEIIVSSVIGGNRHVFYTLTTDISGQTPIVSLPAPPKEQSLTPDSRITPYAVYDVSVKAQGFNDVYIKDMPVFEGIQSVQRVAMVPSLGQNSPEFIPETEPDLNGGV